ncbi:urea ABC transporter ATP-binding protein UrtD (plasmid) [Alcanivorax sp. N3-2A]|nr:urea ABC transporter ATP-binding protein UrtD [Alcanivorax sp. N3-2A]ASK36711.1 urea ABC transporter ATP-binding protein UrtD [Alcanivorax sp. N3-2A]|tara:strand:+ start:22030 stop:22896 length:867 start_codon:yes stop_codon:yes gene_type:complete
MSRPDSLPNAVRDTFRRDQVFSPLRSGVRPVQPGELDARGKYILYMEEITVSFDGFKALNDLTLYIEPGELRCIIGPNGAGKSTMMDVITGKTRPDHGTCYFGQTLDLTRLSETEIATAGIGRKFQKPTVFPEHTALENLELAMAGPKGPWQALLAPITGEQRDWMASTLDTVGLLAERDRPAGALSHGQKQWLEIAMVLMQKPRLLLVDEPIAGMTRQEVERTGELLQSLAGEHSVMVVEHDMEFIRSIANTVTVLHQGSVLAEGRMQDVQNDAKVIEVYLGENVES